MSFTVENRSVKTRRPVGTTILYVAVAVIALLGLATLINNILLYTSSVAQYVDQGYTKAEVVKQLLPGQLLPGVFQPIALYGGSALLLYYVGSISESLSRLVPHTPAEAGHPEDDIQAVAAPEEKPANEPEPAANIMDEFDDPVNTNP